MSDDKKIKVVLLEPSKLARPVEIDASLEGMQKTVGGLIEPFYPFEEEVCIVCNEEGKINGMRPNRSVKNDEGIMVDFIFGPAFICDCRGESLDSLSDEQIKQGLYNASAIGYLAMRNATVAGAVGGCQAEVGIASAMAASATVELMGGSPAQSLAAASTVLMNLLGLVCDPVGGLVEYPCQNRNAAGVANATIAAEIALSGVRQLIPFDEMLEAVYTVGKRLPAGLRETALGGCATTPSACAACHMCD